MWNCVILSILAYVNTSASMKWFAPCSKAGSLSWAKQVLCCPTDGFHRLLAYLPVHLLTCPPACLFAHQFAFLSTCLPAHLLTYPPSLPPTQQRLVLWSRTQLQASLPGLAGWCATCSEAVTWLYCSWGASWEEWLLHCPSVEWLIRKGNG